MTDKQIAPMQAFMDKVKDRLKNDVAELIPEEVLQEMINRVIEEQFFKKKVKETDYSGRAVSYEDSGFVAMVKEAIEPILKKRVEQFVAENADKVEEAFDEIVRQGLIKQVIENADKMIGQSLEQNSWSIQSALQNLFGNRY